MDNERLNVKESSEHLPYVLQLPIGVAVFVVVVFPAEGQEAALLVADDQLLAGQEVGEDVAPLGDELELNLPPSLARQMQTETRERHVEAGHLVELVEV